MMPADGVGACPTVARVAISQRGVACLTGQAGTCFCPREETTAGKSHGRGPYRGERLIGQLGPSTQTRTCTMSRHPRLQTAKSPRPRSY